MPKAWNEMILDGDEVFIDLLSERTEKLCGYKPDNETVKQFISKNKDRLLTLGQPPGVSQPLHKEKAFPGSGARPSRESPKREMTIFDKILNVLKNHVGDTFTGTEIKDMVLREYPGTNRKSVIPSDYCYNLTNKGIAFRREDRIFEYLFDTEGYKYLGKNADFTGSVFWSGADKPVGEWNAGNLIRHPRKNM